MAEDLLGALKALFQADSALTAAIPGGWHVNEGAVVATHPYVTARLIDGVNSLMTSDSNLDSVKIRVRVWATKLETARAAADQLRTTFLAAGGLDWAGGWCTPLRQVNRVESKAPGRAPASAGVLRSVDLTFLAYVRRGA